MADVVIEPTAIQKPPKKKAFVFRQTHLVFLFRQVLADNPYAAKERKGRNKVWDAIAALLKKEGIDAQMRSTKLKCEGILDDWDKEQKKPPKLGSEEEYGELQQLIEELSALRKTEAANIDDVSSSSNRQKEAKAAAQGKSIRNAAMVTMMLGDGENLDGFSLNDETPNDNSGDEEMTPVEAELAKKRRIEDEMRKIQELKRSKVGSTAADALVEVLKDSVQKEDERSRLLMRQEEKRMELRAAELEEQRKAREQDHQFRTAQLELDKEQQMMDRKEREEKAKSESARDDLMKTLMQSLLSKN